MLTLDVAPYGSLSPTEREAVADTRPHQRWHARHLNLGILQAQASRFARRGAPPVAVELARVAADAMLARGGQLQRRQHYAKAARPWNARSSSNRAPRRRGCWHSRRCRSTASRAPPSCCAPIRSARRDPSLQYAYGVALVRSGRADEAEKMFSRVARRECRRPGAERLLGPGARRAR